MTVFTGLKQSDALVEWRWNAKSVLYSPEEALKAAGEITEKPKEVLERRARKLEAAEPKEFLERYLAQKKSRGDVKFKYRE